MVSTWLYAFAAIVAFVGAARIGFLLLFRRPAPARVTSSSLSEMERLYDRDMHLAALADGKPTPEDIHWRGVTARVAYEVDGTAYRSDVLLITHKGDRADSAPVVWYDPVNPGRATGLGLGPAAAVLIGAGGVAVLAANLPF